MTLGERKQREIETIKERTIKLKLSDADCDRILKKAGEHSLTVAELIENFIGDLVDGTYSNGSDERMMAQDWFDRCYFGMFPEDTLLRHLLEEDYNPKDFLIAYTENELYKSDPKKYYEDEEISPEEMEEDALWFEDELEVMLEYWKPEENPDMEKEIQKIRDYVDEVKQFKG